MANEKETFDFSMALAFLKTGKTLSRVQFRDTCIVKAQFPDENSKMTKPYLYMEKKVDQKQVDMVIGFHTERFPFDPSCESIFANDWYLVD